MEEKTGESFEMYQIEEFQKQRMEEGNQWSKSKLMPVRGQKLSAPCQLEKIFPEPCDCALLEHWGQGKDLTNIQREESHHVEGSGSSMASWFSVTTLGTRRQMFSS